MLTNTEFVAKIERHLERSGEAASAFGKRVANDPRLVFDLREGRAISLELASRCLEAVKGWKPEVGKRKRRAA